MRLKDPNRPAGGPPEALTRAIERLLRPLVGLLLEHGLTYTWLAGVLKRLYVDVAEKEFTLAGKRQTDSRITLLTGVHRKDVRQFRTNPLTEAPPPESVYLGAQLVALWTGDDRFLDAQGIPLGLSRLHRDNAEEPSFEELVTSVSKDIRPRAVLDEWIRLGVVEVDESDTVYLKRDAFIPSHGFEEKAFYLGRNLHDHLAAARHNVQGKTPPFMERSVYYDDLSEASVAKLSELAEREGMQVLKKINSRARRLQDRDRASGSADQRMNFGVYFFNAEDDSSA
jgi:hypothetical protein